MNGGDSDGSIRTNKQIASGASRSSARSETPRYPLSGWTLSNCKEIIYSTLTSPQFDVTIALNPRNRTSSRREVGRKATNLRSICNNIINDKQQRHSCGSVFL